ncbi:IS110 family transposase [Rhodococcus ruber]|uniref:IS110 family transposase n=1 Tax=Rhodococcus ruber TaxID=1830 RepID=UPI00315CC8D7
MGTTSKDHLVLLQWATVQADHRLWSIEDYRHLSRRLERDLIAAGEQVVWVPPKLMAHARDAARTYGKSDPIDALAVARAALRELDLPVARLDGVEREIQLLVDHREGLVAERTRIISRLRWHLHELDPEWTPPTKMDRASAFDKIDAHAATFTGLVADLAARLVAYLRRLTVEIDELATAITSRTTPLAPSLLAIPGCAALTAAKIIGETTGIDRFRSKMPSPGTTAPPRCRCGRPTGIDLASRTGNRQLNAALHRIALTQARCHADARALLARRKADGDGGMEALRSSNADFRTSSSGRWSRTNLTDELR